MLFTPKMKRIAFTGNICPQKKEENQTTAFRNLFHSIINHLSSFKIHQDMKQDKKGFPEKKLIKIRTETTATEPTCYISIYQL